MKTIHFAARSWDAWDRKIPVFLPQKLTEVSEVGRSGSWPSQMTETDFFIADNFYCQFCEFRQENNESRHTDSAQTKVCGLIWISNWLLSIKHHRRNQCKKWLVQWLEHVIFSSLFHVSHLHLSCAVNYEYSFIKSLFARELNPRFSNCCCRIRWLMVLK